MYLFTRPHLHSCAVLVLTSKGAATFQKLGCLSASSPYKRPTTALKRIEGRGMGGVSPFPADYGTGDVAGSPNGAANDFKLLLLDCQIWRRYLKPRPSYYKWNIFTTVIFHLGLRGVATGGGYWYLYPEKRLYTPPPPKKKQISGYAAAWTLTLTSQTILLSWCRTFCAVFHGNWTYIY